MRIVCLVPSLSETLCDIGLQSHIVGCTSYCIEPKNLKVTSVMVGGTKDAALLKILELNPTHVLVNKEENTKEIVESLQQRASEFHLIETFPKNVSDVTTLLHQLVSIFGHVPEVKKRAERYVEQINNEIALLNQTHWEPLACSYFIWRRPWMVAGSDTYINSILDTAGLVNAVQGRYPEVNLLSQEPYLQMAADSNATILATPKVCLFSSEPYSFRDRDMTDFLTQTHSGIVCIKVDGKNLSWHGTRTLIGLQYVRQLSVTLRTETVC